MGHYELPLVFFTVIGQAAVGALLLTALLDPRLPEGEQGARRGLRLAGMAIFPLIAVAMLASLAHLGQPLAAIRALRNAGVSWLSREIWVFGLLAALTALYSYLWMTGRSLTLRRAVGYVTSLVGLTAVWTSAMVYALPARAAWSGATNTMAFMATALLVGSLLVATLGRWYAREEEGVLVIRISAWTAVVGLLVGVAAVAGVALLGQGDAQIAKVVLASVTSWLFWVRVAIGVILPAGIIGWMLVRGQEVTHRHALIALCGAFVGELAGRAVFYASTMMQSLWG